jgi:hypothetical protein
VIQRSGRGGGRHYNIDIAIVELVDQHDEAPRSVVVAARELGNIRNEHRVVEAREIDVVILTTRSFANVLELEPHHAWTRRLGLNVPILHRQRRGSADGAAGKRREALLELRSAIRRVRIQIRGRLL